METIKVADQGCVQLFGCRSQSVSAGLDCSVTHSASAVAVCGLWCYISVMPLALRLLCYRFSRNDDDNDVSGWLEPLLDRIAANESNVVAPVIDVIDDKTMQYKFAEAKATNVGGFDWNLQFNWHGIPEREMTRRKTDIEPVRCVQCVWLLMLSVAIAG